jgi:hypothetical protein
VNLPPDILTALLRGEHIDGERREALGLRTDETLRYADVVAHLAGVVSRSEWFPRTWEEHVAGQCVDENIVIQNLRAGGRAGGSGRDGGGGGGARAGGGGRRRWPGSPGFVCHARQHAATDPTALVEETHRRFWRARRAAQFYLRFQLGLPGDLDGWKVVG